MTLPGLVAVALFVGVIVYAVLGGADFGSGFYCLTAGTGKRGADLRVLIGHRIGPVWEANHVWLIYVLAMWWSAFPAAFAAAMTTLYVPLMLALAGIVLRGSSFALRKHAPTFAQARLFGTLFAGSSLIVPFFFGTVAGAMASGRVPAGGYGDPVGSWLNPTSLVGGGLAVITCVFLAGVYLAADADHIGKSLLAEWLRRRVLAVGALSGAIVLAGLQPMQHDAPTLNGGRLDVGFALLLVSGVAGTITLLLLHRGNYAVARYFAVAAAAAVMTGWGVGQFPWVLIDQRTTDAAAGAPATLTVLLAAVALAVVLVLPPLMYLLRLTQAAPSKFPESGATA